MNIVCLDFETRFDDGHSLRRMTTESYLRDSRFETLGCAIRDEQRRWLEYEELYPHVVWIPRDDLPKVFASYDWNNTGVLAHHAQFDLAILHWHYGIKPRFIFDTLSMARLLLGNHLSVSLDSLSRHFGLAAKTVPYSAFKGRHWHELSPDIQRSVAAGAAHDVALTWEIFGKLQKQFPAEEYQVIDTTVRFFTEPVLRGDVDLLAEIWEREEAQKKDRLAALGVSGAELRSSDCFAELLRAEGIEPEQKSGKNGEIFAFAKSDQFMRDLLEHDDDRVRTLAEARLGEKSTLMQTRACTLGWMARRGSMPVYLNYCGAHTTRWSGGDGANWQNFKRGSDLRRAICAPEGFQLCPIDLSQIECRVLCYLAGQRDYVERFKNGDDPYLPMASKAYGFSVTKENPKERGTGKQLVLSCGYQAGAATIQNTARLGLYGPPVKIDLRTAESWKQAYRQEFDQVVKFWGQMDWVIPKMADGATFDFGPLHIEKKKLYAPGGLRINYDTLAYRIDADTGEKLWQIQTRNGWQKFYAGKLTQNICELVARLIMSQAMNRITAAGYKVANCTHDELLILVPLDGNENRHVTYLEHEMSVTPDWLPGLPVACESSLAERYAK